MSPHTLLNYLEQIDIGDVSTKPKYLLRDDARNRWLAKIGSGAPSGTPDTLFYIRADATAANACIYMNVAGTWTALAT